MRVNVYAEELTERIELITKTVVDPNGESHTFYGMKFWLRFPNQPWWIHRKVDGEEDDDSSAVVFWAPNPGALKDLFLQAIGEIMGSDPTESGVDLLKDVFMDPEKRNN